MRVCTRLLVVLLLGTMTRPSAAEGWSPSSSMNAARERHTATPLPSGAVLVAGGTPTEARCELYDPTSGTWTWTGALRRVRWGHSATLLPSGKVLIVGGWTRLSTGGNAIVTASELFDPTTQAWTTAGWPRVNLRTHTATLLTDGRVLVVGYQPLSTGRSACSLYDPATNAWTATTSTLSAHKRHAAVRLPSGRVLDVGDSGVAEVYTPATAQWALVRRPPSWGPGRSLTLLLSGRVLSTSKDEGPTVLSSLLYTEATNTWTVTATPPFRCSAPVLLADGEMLLTGESAASVYRPDSASWTPVAPPTRAARGGIAAARLASGEVVVCGGLNAALARLASSELYDPSASTSESGLSAVWANTGEDKVTRDELRASNDATSVRNSVWDGTQISLFGARNEVVAFNVVLEAASRSVSSVSVEQTSLAGPNGFVIASTPASGDGLFRWTGREIELFFVRYLQIRGVSRLSYEGAYYDERHAPERMRRPWTGEGYGYGTWYDRPDSDKFYPEIAVPMELVPDFAVSQGTNQSVWVDVYVPKQAPAGRYTGTFRIREAGALTRAIPVALDVRSFTLPDVPELRTMLFFGRDNLNDRYAPSSEAEGTTIRDRHFLVAHRHKISLIGDDEAPAGTTRPKDEWVPRLTGTLFSAANGYEGPGVGQGNNVYSIATYGSWGWKELGQGSMWTHADGWATWFAANAPGTEYFLYLIDESSDTPLIQQWASWIRQNPGPGQALRSFATLGLPTARAECPALDIPCSTPTPAIASEWQAALDAWRATEGKRFFMYNGRRPMTGSFCTEDDGVALRVLAWTQYKLGIHRWFYWESTYYNDYQSGMGQTNVFQSARTFGSDAVFDSVNGRTGWNYTNGDGVLFYPGRDVRFPGDSYGLAGPIVSLRLKHWRRGVQDGDYLTMASAVDAAAVRQIVAQRLPKANWEYGVSDPNDPTWVRTDISWSTNPDDWEASRRQLADLIGQ